MATVRKCVGRGGAVGTSTVADGVPLALKMWNEGGDEESIEQFQGEARILADLSSRPGEIPCPRLYDLVGTPVITGVIMEWCPVDLERWWGQKLAEPEAFGRLMATLAEASRRLDDYHRFYEKKTKTAMPHGDLKSSNVLLDIRGRWLISDFGLARVAAPEGVLETGKIVAGTENFLAPEALFGAKQPFPAALDTFALAATSCSLLRLRRVVLDGGAVPRNGSHSPRFRMARVHQLLEVYERDPKAFEGRHLDPSAFDDGHALPAADRKAVREALRGVFGAEDEPREVELFDAYTDMLERATAIDPAHRYTSAADLAVAFEDLTRTFITLASEGPSRAGPAPSTTDPAVTEAERERREAERRARKLEGQLEGLRSEVERLRRQAEARRVDEAEEAAAQANAGGGWMYVLVGLLLVIALLALAAIGVALVALGMVAVLFFA